MISTLNYCAQLQIELARLTIFTHTFAANASMDEVSAKNGEALLDSVYVKLDRATVGKTWIYPRLANSLRHALREFPWHAIYERSNYSTSDRDLLIKAFAQRAAPLKIVARDLTDLNATAVLVELARYIRLSVGVGARTDEHLYTELAKLFDDSERQQEIRHQLNSWALRTQQLLNVSAYELCSELIDACPYLKPAEEILEDLQDRMTNLIYVPLVFDKGKIGVSVPVNVTANFHESLEQPVFCIAGSEGVESPPWLQVKPSFVEAVKRGRDRAVKLLSKRGRNVEHRDFKVKVHLPDLRIGPTSYDDGGFPEHLVEYDQGSIEYPVALALFPQHPLLRSRVPLNPEVMTTGPIDQESLEVKVRASETVGRVASLLATSPNRVTHPNTNAVRLLRTNNDLVVLENYFNVGLGGPRIWESINRSHAKILSIKDARWDQPLKIAEPSRSLVPPLIPTIGRHQQALDEMLAAAGAVQLLGLSGIGKTFLVAQWLLVAQQNYDLVIYASIPNFPPEEKFMTQWVASAFENLGEQLSTSWGRPEFLQKLTAKQTLIGSAWELVGALRESLAGSRILWVIDHAESLLNSDFEISEPRFFALIKSFALGDWENSKLLFVSNRRAQIAAEFPVYELRDGFTFTEACDYLSPKVWRFAELREKVAKVLGNHPRALALLVGHAGDYSIHPAEIRELIHSLPEEQGEVDLREVVCNKILGHVVKHLKSESLAVWWTLLLASVFVEDFTARQFQRLTQVVPASVSISDPFQALSNLVRRSLLSESDGKWAMHSLVRDYSQTIFSREYPKQRKLAHQKAGETYFPLTKSGQILPSPPAHVKSLYADAGGCATALYHFEAAEYVKGEQAILGNYYEHLVPKVQWFMANPRRGTNPIYGFARAEKILRKILEVNASKTEVSAYPGAKEVSYDINRLMGRALFRQRNISKYEEAAVHYREAVRKGDQASLAFLIAVLCDLSDEQPATNSSWLEAEELFETLSTVIVASKSKVPARVGMAYEKVARRYLLLGDPVLADLIVEEAAERSVAWDGVYLAGAEIAQVNLRDEEIGRWLERGLQLVPQSSRLWSRYYQLKVHRGDAHTISDELRFYPRGIHSVVGLSEELAQEGFVNDALNVLHDGLETYKRNATLLAALANTLAHADDLNAAIACYEEAIKEAPLRGELYVALGRLHEVQGNDAAALRTYELGRSNEVIDGQVYIALGGFLAQRGQLKEAVEVFHEGFAIAPKDGHLYNALGSIYKRMSETAQSEQLRNDYIQRALSIYKQGIESCPSVGGLYDSLGDLLLIEGRAQEALEIYKLGSQLAPLHEVLYEKAGTLHAAIDSADSIPLKEIAIDRTSVHSVGNDIMRSVETTSPK